MLEVLTKTERRTLDAYVEAVRDRLGDRALAVRVFGSVARGDSWPADMSIRSDLDVLVLVREQLEETETQDLVDAASASRAQIDADAVEVWPCR